MCKSLKSHYRFETNTETTEKELELLAFDLMKIDWKISNYREEKIINLIELGWIFRWSTRKRAIGACNSTKKIIYLSKEIFSTNSHKSHEFEDTIRHELAHALDNIMRGTSDHGPAWKRIASQLLATPVSTSDKMERVESRYLKVCPNCNYTAAAHKRTRRAGTTACLQCCNKYNGGRYSNKYILDFQINENFGKTKQKPAPKVNVAPVVTTTVSVDAEAKTCRVCGSKHSISEFGKDKATKDGLSTVCKPCERAYRSPEARAERARLKSLKK